MKNISNSECTHKIKNLHKISKVIEKRETTDLYVALYSNLF